MRRFRLLIILVIPLVALAVPLLLFFIRPPVLVVTDVSFSVLYGMSRLQRQRVLASLALFRPVKPVMVADEASPDMLIVSIKGVASQPWCVLFPRSQSSAAQRYHEEAPEIPVVLMGGYFPASQLPSPDGLFCVYGTNYGTDLYRAGLFAGILAGTGQKTAVQAENDVAAKKNIVFWQDRYVQAAERELFSRGVTEVDPELAVIFVSLASQMPEEKDVSCLVLTSAGAEYFEKNPKMPLVLFTWLDPALTAGEVAVIFDDSVWALIVPASKMAVEKQAEGKIPSKPLIFSGRIANNGVVKVLEKSAKKTP